MSTPPPPDVTTVLSAEDLSALSQNFKNEDFAEGARSSMVSMYPPVKPWLEPFLERFLVKNEILSPERRELVILGVFVAQHPPPLFLALHIYASLGVGLSPAQVADALLLASEYSGMGNFNIAIGTMLRTVLTLKQCVQQGKLSTNDVADRLTEVFTPVNAQEAVAAVKNA